MTTILKLMAISPFVGTNVVSLTLSPEAYGRKSVLMADYRYASPDRTSLMGCNSGVICRFLKAKPALVPPPRAGEQGPWKFSMADALAAIAEPNTAFVIDVKPKES